MVGADETTELWRPPLRSSLARGDEEVWYRPNGASSTIPVILGYFINAIAYHLGRYASFHLLLLLKSYLHEPGLITLTDSKGFLSVNLFSERLCKPLKIQRSHKQVALCAEGKI